jgi:hypothetical protein
MTKGEKRSFRWNVLKNSTPQKTDTRIYIKLFDVISKQKAYNEQHVLNKIAEIKPSQIAGFKNYLGNIILDSLEQSNTSGLATIELRKYVNQLHILFEKGLHTQSKTILNKAFKLALQYENYLVVAELYQWKIKLQLSQLETGNEIKIIETDVYKKINIEKEFNQLLVQVSSYISKQRTSRSNKDNKKYIYPISRSKILLDENYAITFTSKRLFYYINATIAYIEENNTKIHYYTKKLIGHFKKNPHQIKENSDLYIIALNNFIISLLKLNRHAKALTALPELKDISLNQLASSVARTNAFNFYYSHTTDIALKTNNYNIIPAQIDDFEMQLPLQINYGKKGYLIVIFFNIICIYFINAEYKKSLKWINNLFNTFADDIRTDLQSIVRFISILIHFELGNIDLIQSQVKSVYRYLEQKGKLYRFEDIMLSFFQNNIIETKTKPQQSVVFIELRNELLKLSTDNYEKKALGYFDFISWLDSKIKKRPLSEILKEKEKEKL